MLAYHSRVKMRAPWKLLLSGVVLLVFTTDVHCCPSVCQCATKNGQLIVSCARARLTTIPADLPADTYQLDLSDNFIHNNPIVFHNGTLNSLKILNLSNNSIQVIHNEVFSTLPGLETLDLSYNSIQYIGDGAFLGIQTLTALNLSGNNNLSLNNNTFQLLGSLVNLDLSKTSISMEDVMIPNTIEQLHLSDNNMERFNISNLENMRSLQYIDLSKNKLSSIGFPPLPSLQTLNVSQNNLTTFTLRTFSALPNLLTLVLDYNPIIEITRPVFQSLSKLQTLSLSYSPDLEYLNKDVFHGLHSLSTLQMAHNPRLEFLHISLFAELVNAKVIDLSHDNITALHPAMFYSMGSVKLNIHGNHLPCDCSVQWIANKNNESKVIVTNPQILKCYLNDKEMLIIDLEDVDCGEVSVSTNQTQIKTRIGSSTILHCEWQGNPVPLLTWITPRGKRIHFYPSHALVERSHPSLDDVSENGIFHIGHYWHDSSSYHSELTEHTDRVVLLSNGDLFIDYMLRSDTGVYACTGESSTNSTTVHITLYIDETILDEIMIWSVLIGAACAAAFFTLNLIYMLISALVRRCINQRRREAIVKLVENMDTYKSAQLARLKDNYYTQLNRIRDGYHNQLERIRENYTSQALRFRERQTLRREWASHKLDTIRDNYNSQVTKLKENSSQKLEQLRDTYNNQLFKIRDYGSSQMARIHKKYKIKQRHVMKLLETMNFDNCRMIIDSECVRTESMIFETDLIHPDLGIGSPSNSDSDAEYHQDLGIVFPTNSESDEYQTATSRDNTPHSSHRDLHSQPPTSHTVDINLHRAMNDSSSLSNGDNSSQDMGDNSSQDMGDNPCPIREDNSDNDGDVEDMYDCDCGELDQMLVQIQMIDDSDDETEKSRNIESCV